MNWKEMKGEKNERKWKKIRNRLKETKGQNFKKNKKWWSKIRMKGNPLISGKEK